ncbi:MAG: hypothetical protein J1E64_08865 [Acetatifactor sp.]|nr:hypothetical protein [Acetatifactor sp.]
MLEVDKIYGLDLDIEKNTKINIDNEKQSVEISLDGNAIIKKFMGNIVTETLNNLEYFALHFSHETADESVVYQSLHQTYLEVVYVLYYNIAIQNNIEGSKYYTNVIELYEKWNNRDKAERTHKIDIARNYTMKGATAEKISS